MQACQFLCHAQKSAKNCQKGINLYQIHFFLFLASELYRGYTGEKLSNKHALGLQINLFLSRLLLVSLKLVKGNIWNDPKLGRIINWKYDKKNAIENKKY